MQAIHQAAFEFIAEYIKDSIIDKCNMERMAMQKEKNHHHILENAPDFYNEHYKTDKLKP